MQIHTLDQNNRTNTYDFSSIAKKSCLTLCAITAIGALILGGLAASSVISMPLSIPIVVGAVAGTAVIITLLFLRLNGKTNCSKFNKFLSDTKLDQNAKNLDLNMYGNDIDDKFIETAIKYFPILKR